MKRREFVRSIGSASAAAFAGAAGVPLFGKAGVEGGGINRRDALLKLIHSNTRMGYTPAAFFIHFPENDHFGPSAVERHLEYFRYTGMDFLKVQYERKFPFIERLQKPADWANAPLLKKDFYEEQLKVIAGIVKAGKREALVIPTVYSPVSFAGHFTAYKYHIDHLNEDPEAVQKGLEIITESTLIFVRECIKLGVDGFFQATQGGEANRFKRDDVFEKYIKPLDLVVAREMDEHCDCNILHIHNGGEGYDDYSVFLDYPSHVVNCGLQLAKSRTTTRELYKQFQRPVMGGMEKAGVIYSGPAMDIQNVVNKTVAEAPEKFILGATCTLPRDIDWANIKAAIEAAHGEA